MEKHQYTHYYDLQDLQQVASCGQKSENPKLSMKISYSHWEIFWVHRQRSGGGGGDLIQIFSGRGASQNLKTYATTTYTNLFWFNMTLTNVNCEMDWR